VKKYAVIMAGGSGTRFWPKSSKKNPKQLLALTGKESQLQLTWQRLNGLVGKSQRLIVCTEVLKKPTLKHVKGAWILAEPEGRNTMAAVCWSAWAIAQKTSDALVSVLPADAFISDVKGFKKCLDIAYSVANSENRIVCLGIKPTFAATAYGYIQQGQGLSLGHEIKQFVEKPNNQKARELFASSDYSWNAGIFVFKVNVFMDEVRKHAPDFAAFFDKNIKSESKIKAGYKTLPSVAIDVALMEKTSRGAIIAGDFGWNDLGSWPAIAEVVPPNCEAGVVTAPGGFLAVNSKNIVADLSSQRFLGLVGVENLIIVETENAILVCHQDQAQEIKTLVGRLQKNKKLSKRLL
jgi:mannose-1-phosphate guanylyltransferase